MSDFLAEWDELRQAWGDPEEIYEDARGLLAPPPPSPKEALAQCLVCLNYRRVRFYWLDEQFDIVGFKVTAERWDDLKRMGSRIAAPCVTCERETQWVSRGWRHEGALL